MKTKAANFSANMHDVDYRRRYETVRMTSRSLMCIDGRDMESLDGRWNFTVDPYETCLRSRWFDEVYESADGRQLPVDFDFDRGGTMDVPSCWNMARPELFYYENMGVYSRTFRYERRRDDERLFLHFEGVAYRAYVFLNGVQVAMHDGASTPFSVEITDSVRRDNRLVVAVDASRSDRRVPMSNTDWFNYGGIYRSVYLVRTPAVFIRDFFIRLVPDSTFSHVALDFSVDGCGQGSAHLALRELGLEEDVVFSDGQGHAVFDVKPELWSPAGPKLYDVSLSVGDDEVHDRVGFREIRVEGMRILLNGEDVFLKGISVHEDDIELGKTTTEESIRRTIRLVKDDLHGVFIRLAHYPHSRLFSRIADEMGVLLWEEVPVYWAIAFDDDDTLADARNQLEELVLRDRNRASVIVWSVGNENPDTDERLAFMSALAARAREMDGTRCISAACLVNEAELRIEDRLSSVLDIIGLNEYYGWYKPDFSELGRLIDNSAPDRPVVISECGADARYGNHGTIDMKWTEEAQAEVYRRQVDEISRTEYIRGMTPWILYDFRAPRRQNIWQEGFNRKGLVDSDRVHRKMAFDVLAGFYESII